MRCSCYLPYVKNDIYHYFSISGAWLENVDPRGELSLKVLFFAPQCTVCFRLTIKTPITTTADDSHKFFFIVFRKNKTWCFK